MVLFRALTTISPRLAATALETLFLSTHRHPAPPRERAWLASARRWSVDAGGRRLAAWSWGRGPTALLVHGWHGRGSQLGALVRPLLTQGFRVVTFDGPGHGRSPGRSSSLPEMAAAVRAVADAVGGVQAVAAHSFGAAAASVAVAEGLRPDRLVFLAPVTDPGRFLFTLGERLGLDPALPRRAQANMERRFGVRWETQRPSRLASRLPGRLLVLHDRHDRQVPFAESRRLADAWPDSELVATVGLGHHKILRDPHVVRLATGFLAGEEVARARGGTLVPVGALVATWRGAGSRANGGSWVGVAGMRG